MHHIRYDVVEQALICVMTTNERSENADGHALGHDLQRVDIEAGIRFIKHTQARRLQQRHLQDLVTLLFAARNPT